VARARAQYYARTARPDTAGHIAARIASDGRRYTGAGGFRQGDALGVYGADRRTPAGR